MSDETKTVDTEPEGKPVAEPPAEAAVDSSATESGAAREAAADESKTSVQDGANEAAALDAQGRERPRFLLQFPEDPELARLSAAFEAGNYALVRAEAEKLAERSENPAIRAAALELRRRIDPDPLAKYLLGLTAALFVALAYFAYHH